MTEAVIQFSRDCRVRIIRRQRATGFKDYVVECHINGTWVRTQNGPWDYLTNARAELRSLMRSA